MTTNPTPAQTPRSPLATGTPDQKVRFDTLQMILSRAPHTPMHKALDGAHWVVEGELPEEVED